MLTREQRKCVQCGQCYKYGVTVSYYVVYRGDNRWKDGYLHCCNSCRRMAASRYKIPDVV